MSEIHGISLHSQSALPGFQRNVREGALLFVRVLQSQGGGNYLASFAGGRFLVRSAVPLKAGDTFHAQVRVADGKVLLLPQDAVAGNVGAAAISVQDFSFQSPEALAFLAGLGLPADGVSQRILQFLMQGGARLDPALMRKVRRLAAKFTWREEEAAETALVLEQKGLDSEDFLDEIMDLTVGDFGGGKGKERRDDDSRGESAGEGGGNAEEYGEVAKEESSAAKKNTAETRYFNSGKTFGATKEGADRANSGGDTFLMECAEEARRFFSAALAGDLDFGVDRIVFGENTTDADGSLDGDPTAALDAGLGEESADEMSGGNDVADGATADAGFLALFNHLVGKGGSQGRKNWIVLPFEFAVNPSGAGKVDDAPDGDKQVSHANQVAFGENKTGGGGSLDGDSTAALDAGFGEESADEVSGGSDVADGGWSGFHPLYGGAFKDGREAVDGLRGVGVFRICFDLERNAVERLSADFGFSGKCVRFVLFFRDKAVRRVLFSLECDADFPAARAEEALSLAFGEGVEVRAVESVELSPFGTEEFPLHSVEGLA